MSRISEFTVENKEYQNLVARLSSLEQGLVRYKNNLDSTQKRISVFDLAQSRLEDRIESLNEGILDPKGLNDLDMTDEERRDNVRTASIWVDEAIDKLRATIRDRDRTLRSARARMEHEISSTFRHIAQCRADLDKIPESKRQGLRFNLRDVRKQLNAVSNVVRNSIRFGVDRDGKHYIRWTVSGLTLRPNFNPYFYVNSGLQDVQIPLQDMYVTVHPHSNSVKINNIPGETDRCPFNWNGPAPHPHILSSDGETCLGDFGGYVTEAIANQDFNVVGTLVNLFLSQAATDDSAGAHWVQYFPFIARKQGLHVNQVTPRVLEVFVDGVVHAVMCVPDRGGWRLVPVCYDQYDALDFYDTVRQIGGPPPSGYRIPDVDFLEENAQEPVPTPEAPPPSRTEPFRNQERPPLPTPPVPDPRGATPNFAPPIPIVGYDHTLAHTPYDPSSDLGN